jgi:hypothetical protein
MGEMSATKVDELRLHIAARSYARHQLDDGLHLFAKVFVRYAKTATSCTFGWVTRRFSHSCG